MLVEPTHTMGMAQHGILAVPMTLIGVISINTYHLNYLSECIQTCQSFLSVCCEHGNGADL
jgi:hypothetical protein